MIHQAQSLRNTMSTALHSFTVHAAAACLLAFGGTVCATTLVDGSFENQAVLQSLPGYTGGPNPPGGTQGAGWSNWGWSSWQAIAPGGAWVGGSIARTEEFAAGWKWAQDGGVFGIIKDRGTMSQTFVATENARMTLSWFDANRPSWKTDTWFGRPNDYSVTLIEVGSANPAATIASFTSQVFLGLESNSNNNWSDDRFSTAGKQGWYARSSSEFDLISGKSYTLSFNSLSPYYVENGVTKVDDRTTFLDNISLRSSQAVPLPGTLAILIAGAGGLLLGTGRRRRVQASSWS
jgi:hypothetical protein